MTVNFANRNTDYVNGIDVHVDWRASKFPTDPSQPPLPGDFKSSVAAENRPAGWNVGLMFTTASKAP